MEVQTQYLKLNHTLDTSFYSLSSFPVWIKTITQNSTETVNYLDSFVLQHLEIWKDAA